MRWSVMLLALTLVACSSPPAPTPAPTATADLSFTGFQTQGTDPAIMDASSDAMSVLAVDGLNFLPDGAGLTEPDPSLAELADHAHEQGLRAELMVGNFDGELNDFSEPLAYETLSSPDARAAVIQLLFEHVYNLGFDGVSIDLEALDSRDADGLSLFVEELDAALGPQLSLSMALPLKDSPAAYFKAGFYVEAMAASIDRFILMAYDEHGPWEEIPGPIGSSSWIDNGLQALMLAAPARKIELGIAGYGYAWGPSGSDGQLSVEQARELAGDRAAWDEWACEWYAVLDDGTEIWWSDTRSFGVRAQTAKDYGIAGVALWSLEQGDPVTPADLK
jgi:spore germination protein